MAPRSKHVDSRGTSSSKPEVAVQIVSSHSRTVGLSPGERNRIAADFSRHIKIRWLPTVSGTEGRANRDAVGLAILIFFVGTTFGAVFKPFFESIAEEAGKDTYSAIKRLIARLWKKEHERLYASRVGVYIIAECADNYVALPVGLPKSLQIQHTLRTLEESIDKNPLLADWKKVPWDEVKAGLEKWDHAADSPPGSLVHVLQHDGTAWDIVTMDGRRFFKHLEIERWPAMHVGSEPREKQSINNTALEPAARNKRRARRGSARRR